MRLMPMYWVRVARRLAVPRRHACCCGYNFFHDLDGRGPPRTRSRCIQAPALGAGYDDPPRPVAQRRRTDFGKRRRVRSHAAVAPALGAAARRPSPSG